MSEKWSNVERVEFEETFYNKIKSAIGELKENERISDSKESGSYEYINYSASKIRKVHLGGVVFRPPAPARALAICSLF